MRRKTWKNSLLLLALCALPGLAHAGREARTGGLGDGGGFVDENSRAFLETTSKSLANKLRSASPEIFQLPKDWSAARLAAVIEGIRHQPLVSHPPRQGRMLMFDFGIDKKGAFITALAPFYLGYSQVPVKTGTEEQLSTYRRDLEIKLLHEVAHLLGKDEAPAEKFATDLIKALEEDKYSCDLLSESSEEYRFIKRLVIIRTEIAYVSVDISGRLLPVMWTFSPQPTNGDSQEFKVNDGAGVYSNEDAIPDRVMIFSSKNGALSAEISFTLPEGKQTAHFACKRGYRPRTLPYLQDE